MAWSEWKNISSPLKIISLVCSGGCQVGGDGWSKVGLSVVIDISDASTLNIGRSRVHNMDVALDGVTISYTIGTTIDISNHSTLTLKIGDEVQGLTVIHGALENIVIE